MKRLILMLACLSGYWSYAQGPIATTGGYGASYSSDGAYIGWNSFSGGGGGETNFVNNIGGGYQGGFTFDNTTRGSSVTTRLMTILGNGNVGVGTSSPIAKLDINGSTNFGFDTWNTAGGVPRLYFGSGAQTFIEGGQNSSSSGVSIVFRNGANQDIGTFLNNGNLGIGTTSPDAKLSVNGTIHTKEVKVDLTGWPDYVFKPTYHLPSLLDVKAYIDRNQHLSEMPSEQEVKDNGINLGEIVKVQTKKIEELTLYLIDKDNQVNDQTIQLSEQKKEIELLKKGQEELKAALARLSASK